MSNARDEQLSTHDLNQYFGAQYLRRLNQISKNMAKS